MQSQVCTGDARTLSLRGSWSFVGLVSTAVRSPPQGPVQAVASTIADGGVVNLPVLEPAGSALCLTHLPASSVGSDFYPSHTRTAPVLSFVECSFPTPLYPKLLPFLIVACMVHLL